MNSPTGARAAASSRNSAKAKAKAQNATKTAATGKSEDSTTTKSSGKTKGSAKSKGSGQRTPGGWEPVGTAASRRVAHSVNGTERGRQSRRQVIDAAREIFERDGYFDARIEDIVATAGVARGTFYTYFSSKFDVLDVLADEVGDAISTGTALPAEFVTLGPEDCVRQFIANYLDVYRANARVLDIVTQVATSNPEMQKTRLAARHRQVAALAHAIGTWQRLGLADSDVDATVTATAFVSMLTNFAYWWMVGGDNYAEEEAVPSLTAIWLRAIGFSKAAESTLPMAAPKLGPTTSAADVQDKPLSRRGYWK